MAEKTLPTSARTLISLATLLVVAAMVLTPFLLPKGNGDTDEYLRWFQHILSHGRFASLEGSYANYSPPYLYLLSASSLLHGLVRNNLILIKLVLVPFDLLCGFVAWDLSSYFGLGSRRALAAGVVVCFLPEMFLNVCFWGQTDVLHTSLLLLSLCMFVRKQPIAFGALFGCAVAVKLQTIFIGPALLGFLLAGEIPWTAFVAAAVAYAALMLPAHLAGRPWHDLLTIYSGQAQTYDYLSMNAPNPWASIQTFLRAHTGSASKVGVVIAALFGLGLALYYRARPALHTVLGQLTTATVSLVLMPYLLPRMHERYFFAGTTFLAVLAVLRRSLLIPAILSQIATVWCYLLFLHTSDLTFSTKKTAPAVLLMTMAIILLLRDFRAQANGSLTADDVLTTNQLTAEEASLI